MYERCVNILCVYVMCGYGWVLTCIVCTCLVHACLVRCVRTVRVHAGSEPDSQGGTPVSF